MTVSERLRSCCGPSRLAHHSYTQSWQWSSEDCEQGWFDIFGSFKLIQQIRLFGLFSKRFWLAYFSVFYETPTLFTLLWVNPSVEISTRPKNSYIPVSEMNLLLFFQDFLYFGLLSLWLCFSFFPPQIVYYSRWKNFSFNILHAWIFTLFVSLLFSFRLLLCPPINLNSHWKTIHHSEQVLK